VPLVTGVQTCALPISLLQMLALGVRSWRLVVASVIAVAVAHALADGAPAAWGVGVAAAISGLCAAAALAWAFRTPSWQLIIASEIGRASCREGVWVME